MKENDIVIRGEWVCEDGLFLPAYAMHSIDGEVVVYEVFRMIDGITLFMEEHMERFSNSCNLLEKDFSLNNVDFERLLAELARRNGFGEGNVMLKCIFQHHKTRTLIYFIPHVYPLDIDYENGVEVGILYAERQNPQAKVANAQLRKNANALIAKHGWYEVLLVNQQGNITEGSRSNIVFVKGGELYSAQLNKVLKGITLMKTLEICKKKLIPIHFEDIPSKTISQFEGAFVTGTSPKLLPVSKVGNVIYSVKNTLIQRLIDEYNLEIQLYIVAKK